MITDESSFLSVVFILSGFMTAVRTSAMVHVCKVVSEFLRHLRHGLPVGVWLTRLYTSSLVGQCVYNISCCVWLSVRESCHMFFRIGRFRILSEDLASLPEFRIIGSRTELLENSVGESTLGVCQASGSSWIFSEIVRDSLGFSAARVCFGF